MQSRQQADDLRDGLAALDELARGKSPDDASVEAAARRWPCWSSSMVPPVDLDKLKLETPRFRALTCEFPSAPGLECSRPP